MGCLVTLALTTAMLVGLTRLMERKGSHYKYGPFFAQEQNTDVLFMGSSHVINAVFPMELWKDYGIVSYNFGGHGNSIATTYWMTRNALCYTRPSLIVVDGYNLSQDTKVSGLTEWVHTSMDTIPLSRSKLEMIFDLYDSTERRLEFIWSFVLYHSRWDNLSEADFNETYTHLRGAEMRERTAVPAQFEQIDDMQMTQGEPVGVQYMRRLIAECQAQGINVLLTYLPFPADTTCQEEANRLERIAQEYGINYLNFLKMDGIVSLDTDCFDADSHLNPSGGQKITAWLGNYIREHYGIPDRRDDPDYAGMNEEVRSYGQTKLNMLRSSHQTLSSYLMLLQDDDYSFCLYWPENSTMFDDRNNLRMLENLGIDNSMLTQKATFISADRASGEICCTHPSETADAMAGDVVWSQEDGMRVRGERIFEKTDDAKISIAVFISETHALVDSAQF